MVRFSFATGKVREIAKTSAPAHPDKSRKQIDSFDALD